MRRWSFKARLSKEMAQLGKYLSIKLEELIQTPRNDMKPGDSDSTTIIPALRSQRKVDP